MYVNWQISSEIRYLLLIIGLFIAAKYLQRFRIPGAVTCLLMGIASSMVLNWFHGDNVVNLFAILGISILFLFAGMDLDFAELSTDTATLVGHMVIQTLAIGIVTFVSVRFFDMALRPGLLLALALLTPSTGFIIDSLSRLGVSETEKFWIKSNAIGKEIVALVILFFALQSSSHLTLSVSLLAICGMIIILPVVFRLFAMFILPYAPKTEFAFLVIVALICAMVTKNLGVYYLVGAFVVGLTEQRLRTKLPTLATAQTLQSIELFASFFIPFYFFRAGLGIRAENFSFTAIGIAITFIIIVLPLRILSVVVYRKILKKSSVKESARLGVALLPTLVFTIVLAEILRDRFNVSPDLIGGLLIFTLVNTVIPSFVLHLPVGDNET